MKRSDTLYFFRSVITGVLLMLAGGSFITWTSPAIVILESDSHINRTGRTMSTVEISMLTGFPMFSAIIGSLLLPSLADRIGRKRTLQLMSIGMILNEIGLALSNSISLMVTFYSIIFTFYAGAAITLAIYLTEICEDHNRAKYGCIMSGFFPIGQLLTYTIGTLLNIQYLTFLLLVPLVIFLIFFAFAPESPVYCLSKGNKEECIKILKKLRSNKTNAEIDIDVYKIDESLTGFENKKGRNFFTVFKSKEGRIGIFVVLLPLCSQYFCGIPIMMPLMGPIFNSTGLSISGNTVAILVGIFKVCSFTFTSLIVEKTGRKPMLVISSAETSIPAFTLGLYFYLKHIDSPLRNHFQWLIVVSILTLVLIYSIGLGPLPNAIMSEFFPNDDRASAVSFVTTLHTFIFPLLGEFIGIHWCLWIFGLSGIIMALLMYVYFPEMKGKSVHEIQEILKNY